MEVVQLHQGVPGGQRGPLLRGGELLLPLIALLRGGQGVVAVAHGEQQHAGVGGGVIPGAEGLRVGQTAQGVGHLGHLGLGQLPAPDVAAVLHQLKVIEGGHVPGVGGQRLDDRLVRVIGQQHDVGQLDGGVLPHGHPGRDAGEDRPLGGPDGGGGAGFVVILLQVHHANEAPAGLAAAEGTLHIEQAAGIEGEAAIPQIAAHGVVDFGDVGLHVGTL